VRWITWWTIFTRSCHSGGKLRTAPTSFAARDIVLSEEGGAVSVDAAHRGDVLIILVLETRHLLLVFCTETVVGIVATNPIAAMPRRGVRLSVKYQSPVGGDCVEHTGALSCLASGADCAVCEWVNSPPISANHQSAG
jgi:hypothetical protein